MHSPRGAVYIPARAWNAWQWWSAYDAREVERDLGYAARLHLDTVRLPLSWEAWLDAPKRVESAWEHCFASAARLGLRVMPFLFEANGPDRGAAGRTDADPRTAVCICSPSLPILRDQARWGGPLAWARRFQQLHGDDGRLLAIEWINEPEQFDCDKGLDAADRPAVRAQGLAFARALLAELAPRRGAVPFSIGTCRLDEARGMAAAGADILQVHRNFPRSRDDLGDLLTAAQALQAETGKPVWLSEWQRLRLGGPGWGAEPLAPGEEAPALATIAAQVFASGLGSFFWSLMLKPAYLSSQRPKGTFNGVFHEDGSVYDLADARAVACDPALVLSERRTPPPHRPEPWIIASSRSPSSPA